MIINPKVAHNFAQVLMKRSKTDAVDTETLAIYCVAIQSILNQYRKSTVLIMQMGLFFSCSFNRNQPNNMFHF